jgi:hypothetical protein
LKDKLLTLLDFSACTSTDEVCQQARIIATELITNWQIESFGTRRPFLGLEFYVFIPTPGHFSGEILELERIGIQQTSHAWDRLRFAVSP